MAHLILPYDWDVTKVWSLTASIETVTPSNLEFLLASPMWSCSPNSYTDFDLSPNEVLADRRISERHTLRIDEADTSWPMEFVFSDERLWLLDGLHRLARLKREDASVVRIRKHASSIRAIIEV